jgi:hypothetical protein
VEIPVAELKLERNLRIVLRTGAPMSHAGRAFLKVCESFAASPQGRYLFQQDKKPQAMHSRKAQASD